MNAGEAADCRAVRQLHPWRTTLAQRQDRPLYVALSCFDFQCPSFSRSSHIFPSSLSERAAVMRILLPVTQVLQASTLGLEALQRRHFQQPLKAFPDHDGVFRQLAVHSAPVTVVRPGYALTSRISSLKKQYQETMATAHIAAQRSIPFFFWVPTMPAAYEISCQE
jgi:hypothetical protein